MTHEEQLADVNAGLKQVLADLNGRPLNPTLVTSYWLVMTHLLLVTYKLDEDTLVRMYPVARALRVAAMSANTVMN